MPEELILIGRIARTHGVRGDVLVNPETDFPDERFVEGRVLQLEMPGRSEAVTIETVTGRLVLIGGCAWFWFCGACWVRAGPKAIRAGCTVIALGVIVMLTRSATCGR